MAANYYVLDLVDDLVLHVAEDVDRKVAKRFATLFNRAWRSVPILWRERMVGFWRAAYTRRARAWERAISKSPAVRPSPPYAVPFIALLSESLDQAVLGGRRRGTTQACVSRNARELRFLAPFVARLADAEVAALIAHELAHVCQLAHYRAEDAIYWDADPMNAQADAIAFAWGHDIDALQRWEELNVEKWQRGLPVWQQSKKRKNNPLNRRHE